MSGPLDEPQAALATSVADTFEAHWRDPGYTCPSAATYPWLWLWDSCFHALVWERLGRADRAVAELRTALAGQDPETGFVPHMGYFGAPDVAAEFWGRSGFSSITQPPMFGHAVAELVRRGTAVPDDVVEGAAAALRFLVEVRRRSPAGLVELVHPWESGADDSPRWDSVLVARDGAWTLEGWFRLKGELLGTVERTVSGAPVANPTFAVGSAAFTALVAFNLAELATVLDEPWPTAAADELATALDERWDDDVRTWVDDGPTAAGSGRIRTAEALVGALVTRRPEALDAVLADVVDPSAFGARFGPTGVHRAEAVYSPTTYWRGPTWPQLSYLLWMAARRADRPDVAASLATSLRGGALRSGLAEFWHPDTAAPGGAVPQSWTGLAVLVDA